LCRPRESLPPGGGVGETRAPPAVEPVGGTESARTPHRRVSPQSSRRGAKASVPPAQGLAPWKKFARGRSWRAGQGSAVDGRLFAAIRMRAGRPRSRVGILYTLDRKHDLHPAQEWGKKPDAGLENHSPLEGESERQGLRPQSNRWGGRNRRERQIGESARNRAVGGSNAASREWLTMGSNRTAKAAAPCLLAHAHPPEGGPG